MSTQDRSVDTPIEADAPASAAPVETAISTGAGPEPDLPPAGSGSPNRTEEDEWATCPTCGSRVRATQFAEDR